MSFLRRDLIVLFSKRFSLPRVDFINRWELK